MKTKITVITPNFPTDSFPEQGAFVETLARHWYEQGMDLQVIAPISIPLLVRSLFRAAKYSFEFEYNVIRPWYMTYSNRKYGSLDCEYLNRRNFVNASERVFKDVRKQNVFYGKFLFNGAYAASELGKKYNIPAIGDLGESRSFSNLRGRELEQAQQVVKVLDGIVCVSERLRDEMLFLGADPGKVLLAPNEADANRFKPLDRIACRRKLNLPLEAKIVAFTGHFIERKGPLRLLQAIEMLDDNVFGIFLGSGKQLPVGKKVLHAGPVTNSELPIWLNASDIFALPTLAEGHCNAVNEALSCGLPVVTSDIDDMRSQLRSHIVNYCNPNEPQDIASAITMAFLNTNSGANVTEQAAGMSRSQKILDWMKEDVL
jgi:glycosyltransferase involved in cell wall biosynthesis